MSRILLLLLFLLWMAWTPEHRGIPAGPAWPGLSLFLGFYLALVLLTGLWSRFLSRRVAANNFRRSLKRFSVTMLISRLLVPGWFAVGLFALNWGSVVSGRMGWRLAQSLPGVIVGTLPAFAAWMGLWWSQYPADRALREQNILIDLDNDLPLHAPPRFASYFASNLRLQVLFTVVPVLLIFLVRDGLLLLLTPLVSAVGPGAAERLETMQLIVYIVSAVLVFILAPEVLRRVLDTRPLPDSPLRRRLEEICRRSGIRCREILLWETQNNMGNAAVMGLVPWVRYVLLSDMLLERMTDEQVEAVFAHEVGHVVHRHMAWFGVFFAVLLLVMAGPGSLLANKVTDWGVDDRVAAPLGVIGSFAAFILIFGYLSRRFERQADVFAARTIERHRQDAAPSAETSHVGEYGATLFSSALHRVAVINNMPIVPPPRRHGRWGRRLLGQLESAIDVANNWFHGSISSRMKYLQVLSADPALTTRFDRFMTWVNGSLLLALAGSAGFLIAFVSRGG